MTTGVFEKGWHPISSISSSTELRVGTEAATGFDEQTEFLLRVSAKAVGTMKKGFRVGWSQCNTSDTVEIS
jgi:hypothetical protein